MRILILALILVHFLCHGEENPGYQNAAKETQEFLKNKKERDSWVQKNEKAKDADQKAEALAGAGGKEQMYDIAGELTQKIAAETGGDPEKMQKLLLEAQKNPEAFYKKYFDESQKAKVRGMAGKIENDKPAAPAPK